MPLNRHQNSAACCRLMKLFLFLTGPFYLANHAHSLDKTKMEQCFAASLENLMLRSVVPLF